MQKQDKPSREALLTRAQQEDATPDELLDREQLKRKRDREKKRKQRDDERKARAASTAETEWDWWKGNRATLSPKELASMLPQHQRCLDLLILMEDGDKIPVYDPDFVSVKELVADVVESVREDGVTHLGYVTQGDIPPDWSSLRYWQQLELLSALEAENPQTMQYVRFGLLSALPDWKIEQFLVEKARWPWLKAADLLGYHTDHQGRVRYK